MDWLSGRERLKGLFHKYKYALLVMTLGVFLMAFPSGHKEEPVSSAPIRETEAENINEQLTQILSKIDGVGKVQVMVTELAGQETVYQTDEDRNEGQSDVSVRTDTVTVTRNGEQTGLVRTITPPVYLGAIVVCQGGANASVRLAVAQAVSAVTGIGMDRITVLKMK